MIPSSYYKNVTSIKIDIYISNIDYKIYCNRMWIIHSSHFQTSTNEGNCSKLTLHRIAQIKPSLRKGPQIQTDPTCWLPRLALNPWAWKWGVKGPILLYKFSFIEDGSCSKLRARLLLLKDEQVKEQDIASEKKRVVFVNLSIKPIKSWGTKMVLLYRFSNTGFLTPTWDCPKSVMLIWSVIKEWKECPELGCRKDSLIITWPNTANYSIPQCYSGSRMS